MPHLGGQAFEKSIESVAVPKPAMGRHGFAKHLAITVQGSVSLGGSPVNRLPLEDNSGGKASDALVGQILRRSATGAAQGIKANIVLLAEG